MIPHSAKRFLLNELEQIESNLDWIDSYRNTELADEYARRYQIVCSLLDAANTPDDALSAVGEKIAKTQQQLHILPSEKSRGTFKRNHLIDLDYLHGLRKRLKRTIDESIYPYALENVQRL